MKKHLVFYLFSLFMAVVFSGCSKERLEESQVNGRYAIQRPYPNIVLELKKGKCVELFIETQDGISFKTTEIQSVGKYPNISYSCFVEGETKGVCSIAASFSSPDAFLAEVAYYISKGKGLDAISWAGNNENIAFYRTAEN